MKNLLSVLPACLVLSLAVNEASANGSFEAIGSGCVPDANSAALVTQSNGGAMFASGQTGTIGLTCAIPHPQTVITPDRMKILYTDSTTTAGNGVEVVLYKLSKTSLTLSTVGSVNTSSTPGCAQTGTSTCTGTFAHTWDPANNWYFVFVYISRTSTANTEAFYGVTLYDGP